MTLKRTVVLLAGVLVATVCAALGVAWSGGSPAPALGGAVVGGRTPDTGAVEPAGPELPETGPTAAEPTPAGPTPAGPTPTGPATGGTPVTPVPPPRSDDGAGDDLDDTGDADDISDDISEDADDDGPGDD